MTIRKRVLTSDDITAYNYDACKKVVISKFAKYKQYLQSKEEYEETLSTSSKVYSDVKINCSGYRNDVEKINIRIEELCLKMKDLDELIADNIDSLDEYEKIIFDGMILHYLTNENMEEKLNKKKDFVVRYKKSCYIKVSKWFHEEVYR